MFEKLPPIATQKSEKKLEKLEKNYNMNDTFVQHYISYTTIMLS